MPLEVSGTFLEGGKFPLGTLLRSVEGASPFESLLRKAFSARAAATRVEWSLAFIRLEDTAGEFNRSEASGSFSKEGGGKSNTCFGSCSEEESDLILHIENAERKRIHGTYTSSKKHYQYR